ncbi:hypothetical protein F2P81_008734 [Scophthalmus maximus]|uniref:Uncharacterized protein n=1 Tax=Scophthalmus maximus TaxID=52904 RepID=A0A6A4T2I6_SCOMX|nr:hypothetical protein F2P81_008734 [Scophthalmus maximus]
MGGVCTPVTLQSKYQRAEACHGRAVVIGQHISHSGHIRVSVGTAQDCPPARSGPVSPSTAHLTRDVLLPETRRGGGAPRDGVNKQEVGGELSRREGPTHRRGKFVSSVSQWDNKTSRLGEEQERSTHRGRWVRTAGTPSGAPRHHFLTPDPWTLRVCPNYSVIVYTHGFTNWSFMQRSLRPRAA